MAANTTSTASNSSTPASSTSSSGCQVPCNNGQCMQSFNSDTYYCNCNPGFSGDSCGTASAPAASPPATANASAAGSGKYTCSVGCVNGQCLQEMNSEGYYCECNAGFSGVACDSRAATAPAPASVTPATAAGTSTCPIACANGDCRQQDNSDQYFCDCNPGFEGADCTRGSIATNGSTAAVTASTSGCNVNCQNGASCKPVLNSQEYYCECRSGYTGWDCGVSTGDSANGATSSGEGQQSGARTLEGWKIFVIVLAAVVGSIMAASVAYIVWRQRRTPTTFVKFNDADMEGQKEIEIRRSSTTF